MGDVGAGQPTSITPPVLICVFNRPAVTRRLVAALRAARVSQLYVAADGPRQHQPTDADLCRQVRAVIEEVDWSCRVQILYRETNLGLQAAVVSAIDWFFEHVGAGIILEDDCIPAPDFFPFAGELLDRFAGVPQVMHVSALNMRPQERFSRSSYFFAEVGHIWGWATWRRAWELYARDLADWPAMREELGRGGPPLRRALGRKFASAYAGRKATWSRSWYYTQLRHRGLAVVPSVNLVENVGAGADATHPTRRRHPLRQDGTGTMAFPLEHPVHLVPNARYERYLARYHARSYAQRVGERARIVLAALGGGRRSSSS